jgi:Domain of unknown function (DUF4159)
MKNRNLLLFAIVCTLLATASLDARQDKTVFTLARVKYGGGGDWYADPSSLPNLIRGLKERTRVRIANKVKVLELSDANLFSYPFLYMTGHEQIKLTPQEVDRLRRYLLRGGFLWCDDNYGFDQYFRREMARVFPDSQWRELASPRMERGKLVRGHSIYHCYYDMRKGLPKIHEHDGEPPRGYGLFDKNGRLMVYYTFSSDIGDGLEDFDVHKDPPVKREAAMRMAINIITYALTH